MGVIVFFSSLSFYHGLDMFLATRDALVINGSYPGFFTSSPEEKEKNHRLKGDFKREYVGFQDGVFYLTC